MMLGWILAIACTLTACLGQERRAMGFMGVRGKKDGEGVGAPTGLTVESSEASSGFLDDDHSSLTGVMAPLHSGQFLLTDKRGPSYMGFQGVRGKKDGELQSPVMFDSDGAVLLASPYGGYDEWKRAPSMGFQGVRGKKAPMGFTGVRGKKDEYSWIEEDKRAPAAGFFGVRGKKGPSSSSFFGMRGKKGPSSSSFFGMRGKRGQNDQQQPEDIEALLQALKDSSLRQDFNGMMDSRVKRLASPAEDSEASPKTNSMQ